MSELLQEIFDKVRDHLLRQNAKAVKYTEGGGTCAYRGSNGTKCAAGVLIPDDLYHPRFEGKNVGELIDSEPELAESLGWDDERVATLVSDLQGVHDNSEVAAWNHGLAYAAKRHGLYCPEPA